MATVVAHTVFTFGLRTDVANNLCFCDEQTVVFPCGNNCVCYNTVHRSQRFIPGSEKGEGMRALAISANRRYLAVSERNDKATITVFDLQHEQGRKRKVLTAGEIPAQEFVCMAFSHDNKYLIGQTGDPEWMLMFWLWEKQKVLASVKSSNATNPITQVSFNPYNNMQLCVSGTGVFKLFRYSEGALKQSSSPKVEIINFLCHTWMTMERVIAGTDTGRLLVFESGDLRREINTSATAVQEPLDRQVRTRMIKDTDVDEGSTVSRITAILSFSKGFVCSMGPGTVCLFEKTEEDSYRRSGEIKIPSDPRSNEVTPAECQEIDTMCISPAEETLAISTNQGQLYSISLSSVDINKEAQPRFEFLSHSFHSKSITGLSICLWKPLAATCSLDRSVRIWNYETNMLEQYKEFQEEAYSVALHPTGLFVLVGFSDKLRLMNLVIDDIRTFKEFTVRGCKECAFSHGGHMFAAANGNVIHIYSLTSFDNILNLKGHNGKIRGIEWSIDDSRLVSCGMDGAVYEWNTQTGKRESESVLKSCSYTGVAFSSDCKTILAVGSDLTLKEIQDCQVLREVPAAEIAHTAVAVSHSGRVIFTGASSGTIRAIKYPLPIQKDWIQFQAHCGPVTKMVITYDDQFLLTVSEDGCLFMWKITDKEGRGLKSNRQILHTEEILVTKSDLEEKMQNMLELKTRLEELQMENEYQLRLKDINYNEKIKEISDKFTQQIESLKTTQQAMRTEMEKQHHEHQESSAEVTMRHSSELKDLESSYSQKLIVEHERYQTLQRKYQKMQENYEKQLKSAEELKLQALEELTQSYEAKLQEKTQQLTQCREEVQQQIREFEEMMKQEDEDGERKIHDIQIKYEKKLHTERASNTNLKGETAIMAQKLHGLQKQIDDKCTDINKLRQERQRLLGLIRSMESDIDDLKRQIAGHEKTNQDKDETISGLKKKNQELEKLRFVLDFQLGELKKQTEPQLADINEKKERICQLKEELVQSDKDNTQLKLTVSDLKLKLKTREKEMHKEFQKVKDLETHLKRLKSDLNDCVGFIQEPKKLKDSLQMIYTRYVSEADGVEKSNIDKDVQRTFCLQRDHMEKTINSLKMRLSKSDEEHEKVYVRIMKENVSLITEINELRKEMDIVKSQCKDYKAQMATYKKSTKSHPSSEGGTRKAQRRVMDKQKKKQQQQSSADVTMKQSKEHSPQSQRASTEHDRYQTLQRKYQKMQENYEKQLKSAEELKVQALEELTQSYEAKLQDMTEELTQSREEVRQQIREFEEMLKQEDEDEKRKIYEIQLKYEKELHREKQTIKNLKNEISVMVQKQHDLQRQLDEKGTDINKLRQERQRLLSLIHTLESDIDEQNRQITEFKDSHQDKDETISVLKGKNRALEDLKTFLQAQVMNLNNEIKPLLAELTEKNELICKLEVTLAKFDNDNTQLTHIVSDLRITLKTREKEMHMEIQKVKDFETYLERLKSDLNDCVGFIQEPKKLKESLQMIYTRYVSEADGVEKSSTDEDVPRIFCRQREHLERTINSLKMRLSKSAEEHEKIYYRITKDNVTMTNEINNLQRELDMVRIQRDDCKAQLVMYKRSTKAHTSSEENTENTSTS